MKKISGLIFLIVISLSAHAFDLASLTRQAEQGNVDAQFDLASHYDLGEGVERDLAMAAKWYRQAAEQGEVAAQYNLAIMYDTGEGVEKDIVLAYMWITTAEIFGYKNARETSKDFAARMTAGQRQKGDELVIKTVNRITQRNQLLPSRKTSRNYP